MTTISVPLPAELEKSLNDLVKSGFAPNTTEVDRRAIARLAEKEAVDAVQQFEKEIIDEFDAKKMGE